MTKSFEEFLKIYSAGISDKSIDISEDIDIEGLCRIAVAQNVAGFICYAINKLFGDKFSSLDSYKSLNDRFLLNYTVNYQRRVQTLLVLEKIKEKNIDYKVIKGICLASLYADPNLRVSTDVDMLTEQDNLKTILQELKGMGFAIEEERDESHHISCTHPRAGIFEVHHKLYDECFDEAWFESRFSIEEEAIKIDIDGVKIPTLGITDGFIFNYLHLIKHFLLTGTTIQQISDVLLYIKKYKNEINWNRAINLFEKLKYEKFFYGLMTIGIKYMNFSKEDFPDFESDVEAAHSILNDLEQGGAYGGLQRKDRDKFYHKYTKSKFEAGNKDISYEKYISEKKHISIMTRLFSRKEILYERYPFIKNKPMMLPIGWLLRWGHGIKMFAMKKITVKEYINIMPDENNEVINERMNIIRNLDMI